MMAAPSRDWNVFKQIFGPLHDQFVNGFSILEQVPNPAALFHDRVRGADSGHNSLGTLERAGNRPRRALLPWGVLPIAPQLLCS